MKEFFFTVALLAGGFAMATIPMDQTTNELVVNMQDQTEKATKVEELPAAVRKELEGDNYKGWRAEEAHTIQRKGEKAYYRIKMVTPEGESRTIKLDESGKVVR